MTSTSTFRTERVKGTTIGATIMGGFGAAWLAMGLASAGVPAWVSLSLVVTAFALIACLGSVVRHRLPKSVSPPCLQEPEKKQMMRTYVAINVVQWLAIFGTVNLLRNLHLESWAVSAIVLIVGAHFFPLAQIFQTRQHVATGVALMLCAVAAVVLPTTIRDAVECVSAGLILWVSAVAALTAGFRMTPLALASKAAI